MDIANNIKVGIGFATGRKNFKKVLRSYIFNWAEAGLFENKNISFNLFIAYDLSYNKTKKTDYTQIRHDILKHINNIYFLGYNEINESTNFLVNNNIIEQNEANMIFGKGYAAQRNAILYSAVSHDMDYLIFLDDDEYPIAVTNTKNTAVWGGQQGLATHLKYIKQADLTHGYHCGYISPIPYIEFNDIITESDFKTFIEAISNDILNWDKIKEAMNKGGVTYANTKILTSKNAQEVQEVNHSKFISGSNLCINLTNPQRTFPFYNPPGARGEDTFYSTCLSDRKILKVPCYTFHDGFSVYNHLLEGVLPTKLKFIEANNKKVITRFYKACIGWVRYKPLLLYITQRENYEEKIDDMFKKLNMTLPKLCDYFQRPKFMNISSELNKYNKNVEKHYNDFVKTKKIWAKIMQYYANENNIYINKQNSAKNLHSTELIQCN